ncbi:DUF7536 family protein [Haloarchaeobius amylolyticus]|uniref:DUF7536 family protein n=1 Tax=Haloarchaeobius amylolyticus TaxID=1198296 RepID=UPI00226E27B1|nr:hypothetical protein [Haloarchaeobius amylolyticus]
MSENTDTGEDRPGRPPMVQFFAALGAGRNVKIGVASGLVLAFALFAFFVALPGLMADVRPRTGSPLLYVVLGFVVFVSTAMFVATVLTARNAVGAVMSPPKWVRRGGTVGALGGLVWLALTDLAVLAETTSLVGAAPSAATLSAASLLLLPGIWAVYTKVKFVAGDLGRLAAVVSVVGLLTVHVGALLTPEPVLATTRTPIATPFAIGLGILLAGTGLFGLAARDELGGIALVAAAALPVSAVGFAAVAVASPPAIVGLLTVPPLGLAWVLLGKACRDAPTPAGWEPADDEELFEVLE